MNTRPKIDIERSDGDKLAESAGRLVLLLLWGIALYGYLTLPAFIPVHFDGAGRVDAQGPKMMILALPLIGTLLYTALTVLNRYPHTFNYPVPITAENARHQYTIGTRVIRSLKLSIAAIFLVIALFTCLTAAGKADGLPWWFFPLTAALPIVPVGYYMYRMFRGK